MDEWRRYHKIDPNKSIEDLSKEQDIDQLALFTLQVMKKYPLTKHLLLHHFSFINLYFMTQFFSP